MGSAYVIYYGWLIDDADGTPREEARRIAQANLPLLIAEYLTKEPELVNMSPQVLALMKAAGTGVFAYVRTNWTEWPIEEAVKRARRALAGGVDGIFLDETPYALNAAGLAYYRTLADLVHDAGKRVIVNPGMSRCDQRYMAFADFLMAEHQWRGLAQDSPWTSLYPPDRFMGVSTNVSLAQGVADTREAWSLGLGWHTSTEVHIALPPWFEQYVAAVSA